jgi:anti-sigma factor ChrR (cupin superfamily)
MATDKHLKQFNADLKGKTIKRVLWLDDQTMENAMWYNRPVVIEFTDGSILMPQSDDEGNDGGALFYADEVKTRVIYTTR